MMFSLEPVGIDLPVDVNNVALVQSELPEEKKTIWQFRFNPEF